MVYKVKEMFASRFGSTGRIVEVDYTALEVVALAAISHDDNLMRNLLDGTDMHCYRLAGVLSFDHVRLHRHFEGATTISKESTLKVVETHGTPFKV